MLVDLKRRAQRIARAAQMEPAKVLLGLMELYEWSWVEKTAIVAHWQLRWFFGPYIDELTIALTQHGLLRAMKDGYRICGASSELDSQDDRPDADVRQLHPGWQPCRKGA